MRATAARRVRLAKARLSSLIACLSSATMHHGPAGDLPPPGPRNGDGGIRTLDTGLSPYDGLANRCLQPLGHVSSARSAQKEKDAWGGTVCKGRETTERKRREKREKTEGANPALFSLCCLSVFSLLSLCFLSATAPPVAPQPASTGLRTVAGATRRRSRSGSSCRSARASRRARASPGRRDG